MNLQEKRIRILYVASTAPVDFTTSDSYFVLPNWLSKHCHVTLVCPPPPRGKRIAFEKNLENFIYCGRGLWQMPTVARTVARIVSCEQYDVIMTGVDERSLLLGVYASFKAGCRLIAVCEDHPFQSRYHGRKDLMCSGERAIRVQLLRLLLRRPVKILCFVEKEVLSFLRVKPNRLIQMSNGVDDSLLSLGRGNSHINPFSIGYIGAVEEYKGSLDMLAVLAKVRQQCGRATLTLIGPYVSEEHRLVFERRCAELGLNGAVQVTGYKRHWEALELLRSSAVCVHAYRPLPWLYYNQVLKVAEYMAVGKAIVSWDFPGVRRLLDDGRAGLLVEPGNLNLMAESIEKLLTEDSRRQQLEKCANETAASRLLWSKIGQEVLDAIIDTLPQVG
jgi:glycosyltransferase involved in cell wall biosynthesis